MTETTRVSNQRNDSCTPRSLAGAETGNVIVDVGGRGIEFTNSQDISDPVETIDNSARTFSNTLDFWQTKQPARENDERCVQLQPELDKL